MQKSQAEQQDTVVANFLKRHAQSVSLQAQHPATKSEQVTEGSAQQQGWTAQDTLGALRDCPYDDYLGLKFYHSDPLPWIKGATGPMLFVDYEFPVHHPSVVLKKRPTPVAPGIITSRNCSDFEKDGPKRSRRIKQFMQKAECLWTWVRGSSIQDSRLFSAKESSIDPRNVLQGSVGNCGFCSGFASLACDFATVLRDAFGDHSAICISECGAYSVCLYPKGQKRCLLMDDYILCTRNSDASPSLHSLERGDLWKKSLCQNTGLVRLIRWLLQVQKSVSTPGSSFATPYRCSAGY